MMHLEQEPKSERIDIRTTPRVKRALQDAATAGYVVLYEHHEENDIVLINSIRHTREAGYKLG
ncbi:type II toxin-antitoxin system RelE/ParE family toxin [Methylovulum psychrotolerans]|uniref:type II toxin-antitoxin system RelE/ParE family toxin n=1 Tax=Methylovulum psychrotolerans TaxID=1704499 RepID=UPI001BFF9686|nr:type II toxin-antitoxin system RelE/ParE family toxin [Methylovulum psychrotolerans]